MCLENSPEKNVSDLQKALRQVSKYAEENRKHKEELKTFLSLLSHDLKAPMNHVSTFITMALTNKNIPKDVKSYLSRALKSCFQASRIVDGVNLLSKVSLLDSFENVDLNNSVEVAKLYLQESIKAKQATVEVTGTLPTIRGNTFAVEHVFINVISNSLKFVPDKPRITISPVKYNCVVVEDNGPGVDEEMLEYIFLMFNKFSKSDDSGSGVGLGIVKKIMEAHNGHAWAKNRPEGGLSVYLDFNNV